MQISVFKLIPFASYSASKKTFLNLFVYLIDWVIESNGMSNHWGLFYVWKLENCLHRKFMFTFLYGCLRIYLFVYLYFILTIYQNLLGSFFDN